MTTRTKGLPVEVLRSPGIDCTRGGITTRHDTLILVGILDETDAVRGVPAPTLPVPKRARVFQPQDGEAVILHVRPVGGRATFHLAPAVADGTGWTPAPGWHMAGGNYASTSDSRFDEILHSHGLSTGYVALSVHDRQEN